MPDVSRHHYVSPPSIYQNYDTELLDRYLIDHGSFDQSPMNETAKSMIVRTSSRSGQMRDVKVVLKFHKVTRAVKGPDSPWLS